MKLKNIRSIKILLEKKKKMRIKASKLYSLFPNIQV